MKEYRIEYPQFYTGEFCETCESLMKPLWFLGSLYTGAPKPTCDRHVISRVLAALWIITLPGMGYVSC